MSYQKVITVSGKYIWNNDSQKEGASYKRLSIAISRRNRY